MAWTIHFDPPWTIHVDPPSTWSADSISCTIGPIQKSKAELKRRQILTTQIASLKPIAISRTSSSTDVNRFLEVNRLAKDGRRPRLELILQFFDVDRIDPTAMITSDGAPLVLGSFTTLKANHPARIAICFAPSIIQ